MKLKYEKPMVMFESFELSTSICGSCGGGVNSAGVMGGYPGFANPSGCAWVDSAGNAVMFYSGSTICASAGGQVPGDGSYDGIMYCYNNPSGSENAIFSS